MNFKRILLRIFLVLVGLFVVTYIVGWFQAYRLAGSYYRDAESAYAKQDYLDALVGYKAFDPGQNKYVQRGGYLQVEHIWKDPYALPRPPVYALAQARIREIIDQRLTISMAEAFVQENIGKQNPYLGIIYLRLGELYEASGDQKTAIEIYRDVVDLFPGQADLISKARDHLTRLGIKP